MTSSLRLVPLALLALACTSSEPDDPLACGSNGTCPAGYTCEPVTRRCIVSGGDAAPAAPDARPDAAPPADAAPATIDAAPPAADAPPGTLRTMITGAPPARTNSRTASFTFTSVPGGATFECARDGQPLAPCGSPKSFDGLADGVHTFEVHALLAGQRDATGASASWTVDATGPNAVLTGGPTDGSLVGASGMFTYSTSPLEAGATFQCAFDGPTFSSCDPAGAGFTSLPDGSKHTFKVRAVDDLGNIGPEVAVSFTIDISGPTVTIVQPADGATVGSSFTLVFTYPPDPGATFVCMLDDKVIDPCVSGHMFTMETTGPHHVTVQGKDVRGNLGPPAGRDFTVAPAGTVTIASPAAGSATGPSGMIVFDPSDAVSFDCTLDGKTVACNKDGYAFSGLESKSHTFTVTGSNAFGDRGPTTTFSWRVAWCGDKLVQADLGEECDDGNAVQTDACLGDCKKARCGDKVVRAGVEQCDDGNDADTDACLNSCMNATCGDGFIRAGVELCDGEALGGATCVGLGYDGGTPTCTGCSAIDDTTCGFYPTMAGDLVITEIHRNPLYITCTEGDDCPATCGNDSCDPGESCRTCPDDCWDGCDDEEGQWIELHNATGKRLDLDGVTVVIDTGTQAMFTIGGTVLVQPGGYAVLGNGPGGTPLAYDWLATGVKLPLYNAYGLSVLARTAAELDAMDFPGFPDNDGYQSPARSLVLSDDALDAVSNDSFSHWCEAADDEVFVGPNPYGDVALGTPGAANPVCHTLSIDYTTAAGTAATIQARYAPSNDYKGSCSMYSSNCSPRFSHGQKVTLSGFFSGGLFDGWKGNCEGGVDQCTCTIPMDGDQDAGVDLVVTPKLILRVKKTCSLGAGSVSTVSTPLPLCAEETTCNAGFYPGPTTCEVMRPQGTQIVLSQATDCVANWYGCDSLGPNFTCNVTLGSTDKTVTACVGQMFPDPESGGFKCGACSPPNQTGCP